MKRVTIPLAICVAAIIALEACGEHADADANANADTATATLAPGTTIILARSRDGRLQVYVDVPGARPRRPEHAPRPAPPLDHSGLLLETASACPDGAGPFLVDAQRR
jgi:hypothetical protein